MVATDSSVGMLCFFFFTLFTLESAATLGVHWVEFFCLWNSETGVRGLEIVTGAQIHKPVNSERVKGF